MSQPADPTHGYERHAAAFIAGRNRPGAAIGVAEVRAWARDLPRDAAVLDVACGSGLPITRALVEEGHPVFALDAWPAMVAAFRGNFPRLSVACEPIEKRLREAVKKGQLAARSGIDLPAMAHEKGLLSSEELDPWRR